MDAGVHDWRAKFIREAVKGLFQNAGIVQFYNVRFTGRK